MSDDVKNLTKDVQDRIRDLAYLMWESAGRQQNMALQYWLDAERETLESVQAATETMLPARGQRRKAAQNPAQPATPSPVDSIEASQAEAEAAPAEAAASAASEISDRKPATAKAASRRKTTK